jgi:cyclic pyranopterin phosphate synthase
MSSKNPFSHLDGLGEAHMVDVSEKPVTRRVAEASCRVQLSAETLVRLSNLPKGDAYAVARLAGIQAAKRTGEWVPLAHPLNLDQVEVQLAPVADGVEVKSRVTVTARTGAEDMVKSHERGVVITDLHLDSKSGGRSGEYRRPG